MRNWRKIISGNAYGVCCVFDENNRIGVCDKAVRLVDETRTCSLFGLRDLILLYKFLTCDD
jgi:hypothetical protein